MPVKIISDSTCDLSPALLEAYEIAITPLTVTLGARAGHDGTEILPEDIYAYVEATGCLPKTSAVSIGEYLDTFRFWRGQGYEIVQFCISRLLSGAYQNACAAAREVGGVQVVDSGNLSTGQGLLVLRAAELARSGQSAEEIVRACQALVPRVEASFVPGGIDYLYKGGRCSALAAFGTNLLHLRPCIEVIDGRMEPGKRYRGATDTVLRAYIGDRLRDRTDIDLRRIFLNHTRCDPKTVALAKRLIREACPQAEELLETTAGATITTHCGPETLAVMFLRTEERRRTRS